MHKEKRSKKELTTLELLTKINKDLAYLPPLIDKVEKFTSLLESLRKDDLLLNNSQDNNFTNRT